MEKKRSARSDSAPPIELTGTLALRSRNKTWGNPRRMALLAAIGEEGSITAAAKKVGLSYKAAWDAVDAMNNLADEPLVTRITGGQRGGGATLTPRAVELIAHYEIVSHEHERFMKRLAGVSAGAAHNLELMEHMMIQTSARNKLAGTIRHIKSGAVNDEIIIEIAGGTEIVATITSESVHTLELRVGRRVLALIKASSVLVGLPTEKPAISARNQIPGGISRIVPGAVNGEVSIELAYGQVITAVVSLDSIRALALTEGKPAVAIFMASSVILAGLE
ncbi:MAG TPA: TOBE domain-containing protein [Burkholderiaceae bacterium]|nr:TOBE domain-containing protein [Burkholderiaceae bacterium]